MADTQKEDKSVPWEDFEMGTAEKENAKRKFPLITLGLYEVMLAAVRMEKKWNKYANNGKGAEETQIRWVFDVVCNIANPQGGIQDTKGELMESARLYIWSKPSQTGTWQGQPQMTRMVTTSLLGLPSNSAIPGEKLTKELADSLVGKSCQAFIETKAVFDDQGNKTGEKQVCKKFMPLPKRQNVQSATTQPGEPAQPVA